MGKYGLIEWQPAFSLSPSFYSHFTTVWLLHGDHITGQKSVWRLWERRRRYLSLWSTLIKWSSCQPCCVWISTCLRLLFHILQLLNLLNHSQPWGWGCLWKQVKPEVSTVLPVSDLNVQQTSNVHNPGSTLNMLTRRGKKQPIKSPLCDRHLRAPHNKIATTHKITTQEMLSTEMCVKGRQIKKHK